MLLVLGALAAFAIVASEMPRAAAWPMAGFALLHAGVLAHRERRRAPRALVLHAAASGAAHPLTRATAARRSGRSAGTVDGVPLRHWTLRWRGPLAVVRWQTREGQMGSAAFWPDVLTYAQRRELRLAAPRSITGAASHSVAP